MIQLNQAQRAAVEYLDGPLLVLAGPGTGKTQLLSSRVANILEKTDASPDNILCITFTEAGADNMRERLNSLIGKDANKIHVSTYHQFGTEILRDFSNYSEHITRRFDSPIDEVAIQKIIKNIQSKLPASDILRGDPTKSIADAIKSAKSARLTPNDLKFIAEKNLEDSEVLSSTISPLLDNITPRKLHPTREEVYEPIFEILKPYSAQKPILKTIDRNISSLSSSLEKALDESKETNKLAPLSKWKKVFFDQDSAGKYRLKDRIANKKLLSLANIMSIYNTVLKENNLYDFSDMIEEAISALKQDDGFRLTLSEKYQFILLDEFQDTNPSQFELIKLLTDYEKPLVMAVGDDDQAIFEFQGASATSLSVFKNHYNAHVINLTENYRSTPEILEFSHKIIDQVDDSFVKTQPELGLEKILHANRENPTPSQIRRKEFISSDAEYFWLAEEISNLLNSGVSGEQIAIIAPKYKYITPLLPYLKSHPEINIAYERRDNILEDEKIHELTTISRLIHNLVKGVSTAHLLPEILGYDFWQLKPLKVFKALQTASSRHLSALDYLSESDDSDLKTIADFFAHLALKSPNLPLELFLDLLIGTAKLENLDFRSPFLDFYTQNSDYSTFKLYESLSVLKEKLRAHLHVERPTLSDFIEFLDDYALANMGITNTSPYRDSKNSVQILSAHKSKGLEFDYVFLIDVNSSAWGKSEGNNNMLALPKNLTQIRHTGSTDSERIRLFFVAITRARKSLTMLNSISDFANKTQKRLEYLNEHLDDKNRLISPLLPEESSAVDLCYDDLEEAQKKTDLHRSWVASYQTLTPEIRPILEKRLENYHLTATGLTTFIDIAYAGPLTFFKSTLMRAPSEPSSPRLVYGTLIHSVFEKITKDHISEKTALEFYCSEAEKAPLASEEIEVLIEKGKNALPIVLKAFGEILRTGKAEVDLFSDHISFDGVPLTGKIDHLAINDAEKTLEIYDYKTGTCHPEKKWWGDASLIRYMTQLNFYKILLENSKKYKNYKITRGHILFVDPNKDNEVFDKVYDFNQTDSDIFQKLIKTVYAHIKSLDFIDPSSPLALEPDVDKNHNDLKDFIHQLITDDN